MPRTLTARHDAFALARPFRIARGVKSVADVITVTIADDGQVGRGEGVPYARYGETIASALTQVAGVRGAIEAGSGRTALLGLLPPGAARNAIDCALWDLERANVPSGAHLPRVASAITLGIDTPDAMAAAARTIAGVPVIKVKVDADDPATCIRAVRAAAPNAALIVDPNESWDEPQVRAMQAVLIETRVALLEQPCAVGADDWQADFTPQVPIAADEAVHVAGDLDGVASCYQVINVKLDKAGGLTAALALADATRARGLGLMIGCMVSSSLSIAPALRIAARADYVDLDGPLWLAADRPGGVRDDGGWLLPPAPGFWGG